MKICITSNGKDLVSQVDPRFGRCENFIIFDIENGQYEVLANTQAQLAGGAGIQSAQTVVTQGAQVVLTGNMGPNAHQVLSSAGITIMTGVSGSVQEAIENYRQGKYQPSVSPTVSSKSGLSS
jgi:predicted Fe-Mo cluster-binding NifX family protein